MKDNHETGNKEAAEREISSLYRKMAKEQPPEELDNTILHLARNKEMLMAEAEVKPVSLMARIKARSAPLAMAASVVLVGSVVLLQDWRGELVPKRYGPQSGSYDHAAPQAEPAEQAGQTLQSTPASRPAQTRPESAAQRQIEQQEAVTLDERALQKHSEGQGQNRFRVQPEVERLLPAADAQLDKASLKAEFGQDAAATVSKVQAYTAPGESTGATKVYKRPAKSESQDKAEQDQGGKNSPQQGIKASSMAFSQQAAANNNLQQQKPISAWLAEIEQLLAAGEQTEVINQLKAFVAANPDYPLAEKYQKLLSQLENN
ncbi:hypothetical protein [Thalassomonas haliotis]|uniref:Anti sigma-E protein RseA N-terminal domain-containing protein n=1 Tax=Thalassomonas haliotis TaxID=485448 RepID=A0ABY7VPH8_9GAMM|nr:hypothetical protein [Thalassomonas haliotis]WDE14277.1 hypothetical protein H3N35_13160 [Thalassomonas haliotis]